MERLLNLQSAVFVRCLGHLEAVKRKKNQQKPKENKLKLREHHYWLLGDVVVKVKVHKHQKLIGEVGGGHGGGERGVHKGASEDAWATRERVRWRLDGYLQTENMEEKPRVLAS